MLSLHSDHRSQDAVEVADKINAGEITKESVVEITRALIEKENPQYNAIVDLVDRPITSELTQNMGGRLNGVPFLIKELGTYGEGLFYREGSARSAKNATRSKRSSNLVNRLKGSGAVLVGSTSTSEFGLEARTEPEAFGAVMHPWKSGRSTGGSSGGSATAVARGWVPFAHATDGAGSIRLPAAFCGVIGLKPSRGRISFGPSIGETLGLFATNFFLTRSIRDTALLLDIVAGGLPGDYVGQLDHPDIDWLTVVEREGSEPLSKFSIGLSFSLPNESPKVDSNIKESILKIARSLESNGHKIDTIESWIFGTSQTQEDFEIAWYAMAAESVRRVGGFGEGIEEYSDYLAKLGESISAGQLAESLGRLTRLGRFVESKIFGNFDFLMTPVCPVIPPVLLSETRLDPKARIRESLDTLLPFTYGVNVLGYPAISLPLRTPVENEPCGLQIIARMGREDLLLKLSRQLELLDLIELSPLIVK